MNGYCVRCRSSTEIKAPKQGTAKNGRHVVRGSCGKCGTKISRFVSPTKV